MGLAGSAFLDAIQFSLMFWGDIMQNSKLPLGATFASNINVPTTINFNTVQFHLAYFTANEQGQLEEIYRQSCTQW